MSGNNNFTEPQNFEEAWKRSEKRQQRQERRTPGAAGAVVSNEGLVERVFQGGAAPLISGAFILPAEDWAIDSQSGIAIQQSYGSLVQWYITVTRVGPPLAMSTSGNIGNNTVGTLTDGWVPVVGHPASSGATGRMAAFHVALTGTVQLVSLTPDGGDVATGESLSVGAFYIAVNPVA